ncbi:MAG: ABC transporter ATP-binding protein [Anaerolineales bacterium]|jgi:peptide/nickel transport system ATP-binding protein
MISIKNIKASYFSRRGEVQAVDGVDLEILDNEILGIAGESGCGKSTLLKVVYGYLAPPLRVVAGTVDYHYTDRDGHEVALGMEDIRQAWWKFISYIPQGSMNVLNPVTRIESQFMDTITRINIKKSKSDIHQFIVNCLNDLDLPPDILKSYPHQLSGGMRQRVVVALATFLKPGVILADEPTTAVDVVVQRGILTLLTSMQKDQKNTLVFVSHDMGVHYQTTDRLAIMYAGKIVELGPTDVVVEHPLHPYPEMLIRSLPRIGDRQERDGISGSPPSLIDPPVGCRFAPRCPSVMDICRVEEPQLVKIESNHFAACHLLEIAEDTQGITS